MYIPISRIHAASLTRSPHQEAHAPAAPSVLSFQETLVAVSAAIEDQARRIKKKYGLSVRIKAVSKERDKPGEGADREIRESLQEIVIAPNILQQMSHDSVMLRKIYGYIDQYAGEDHTSAQRSLIIHRDGTCTFPFTAPSPGAVRESPGLLRAGPADVSGGSSAQDRLQQLAYLRARRSHREP